MHNIMIAFLDRGGLTEGVGCRPKGNGRENTGVSTQKCVLGKLEP